MLVFCKDTQEIYHFITQDNDTVYLEAYTHDIFKFDIDFYNEHFAEVSLERDLNDN